MTLATVTSRLLTTLYSAPMQPELWDVFLAEFANSANVYKAALLSHNFRAGEHSISASYGDSVRDADRIRAYENYYSQFDEWTRRVPRRVFAPAIFQGVEIWPEDAFRTSTFYNEFLAEGDICGIVGLVVSGSETNFEALSLFRGPRENPFDREHRLLLQTITPHLQSALAIRRRFLALESKVSDLETALDQLGTALVLLDEDARPILVNRAARQIFDRRDGLYLSTARLSAQRSSENGRLREIVAKAISAGRSKSAEHGGAMLVSRADKRPLQVLAAPFISQSSVAPKLAVAVVFISDPEKKPTFRSEILREFYRFTQAETRLAALLADGHSLNEAAELHSVTQETVRSQLKAIFQKTGTKRQAELVRMLSGLPGR
jgi:DNA-binding CsgD family transcriptional regulator/PAS domain-containing protein